MNSIHDIYNEYDETCLAEGYVVPADFNRTGLNQNEILVGTTGSGKTISNAYSRLLHTFHSSVVVPITKKALKKDFTRVFDNRGYEVIDLNFAHPEECDIGYDPMNFIHTDEDVIQTARNIIWANVDKETKEYDPYWRQSSSSVLAAIIHLERHIAGINGEEPCFANVIQTIKNMKIDTKAQCIKTSLDNVFEELELNEPENPAPMLWKAVKGLSSVTASCILSHVVSSVDKLADKETLDLMRKKEKISFRQLGKKKIALFITTSPMNKSIQCLINMMYSDLFRELFEQAERSEEGKLDIPVHVIADDFACGSRIPDFDEYISIFRAAGISVSLLLQSESQLVSMYGQEAATTIINNCDTYVYLGGMDTETCNNISRKVNKPINKIMSLGLERVIVLRRGCDPFFGRRYQTFEDPIYKEEIGRYNPSVSK